MVTPTPVREVAAGLWIKDESAIGAYGGNKVRKLHCLLTEALAEDRRAVVTVGGAGSHHVLATALYARAAGLDTHAVLFAQPRTDDALRHAAAIVERCASVTPCPDPRRAAATMRALAQAHRASSIPVGGSSVTGARGWVDGGREIAAQIAAGALPRPRAVWVPSASGGTAAGLAIGLAGVPVIAVRIGSFLTRARLERLLARTAERAGVAVPEVELVDATDASPPLSLPGLEPTYTGPALATCLARRAAGGPDLFVHTASRWRPPTPTDALPPEIDALLPHPSSRVR